MHRGLTEHSTGSLSDEQRDAPATAPCKSPRPLGPGTFTWTAVDAARGCGASPSPVAELAIRTGPESRTARHGRGEAGGGLCGRQPQEGLALPQRETFSSSVIGRDCFRKAV
ncbi:hypothetical protein Scani_44800 [Streptomyces caniferus]|uniref:Uncharacterized protein n=1 Tax=Streptomyces caniferus TaxID=285557 RepID=A0A640SCM6_9ACTN|nr:hypothetical protein Scani_44800 [Streptomyces caniferus]